MDQARLFGQRIRSLRRAARMTQERAAEAARLNAKYLGQIERGEKRPSFDATVALAKALRVSPACFFQFDREDNDERTLRRKIEGVLHECTPQQLQLVYRILRSLLEP